MKILVNQGELEDKLLMASKAVARKTVKPVLAGFLIKVDESVVIYATDLETAVKAEIRANEIEGEGQFVVEAATFLEIVKNLPSDLVELELEGSNLVVSSGRSKFNLPTMDPSEFPEIITADTDKHMEIDTSILDEMIDKVMFAAATDEFMKNLNGVYWELMGSTLRLVASDGFRLALMDQPVELGVEMGFLISLRGMKELSNVVANTSEPTLKLKFDGKRFAVQAGDVEVVMRVVDADFPDYRRVLPESYTTRVVISRDELLDSLKRMSVMARKGSEAVKLEVEPGLIVLTSRSPDHGEAVEELEAEVEGEGITTAFNPKFLVESVRRVDTAEVELLFVNQTAPLKIKPLEREDYFYIIMPIRIA